MQVVWLVSERAVVDLVRGNTVVTGYITLQGTGSAHNRLLDQLFLWRAAKDQLIVKVTAVTDPLT